MMQILDNRYRLDELIADSPVSKIWRAVELERGKIFAIKVFHHGLIDSDESIHVELRRAAKLSHPGIIPIHEVGSANGNCFVVSDLVEGGSLADFVGRQILSPQKVVRWVADIAEALEYAHANGVVHGDIKPSNILIDIDGRAILTDFGTAQIAQAAEFAKATRSFVRYQSPEQIEGKPVDARSDLYSLGVILHELLTGKLPYQNSQPSALKFEIVRGAQIDTQGVPPELRRCCQKVLQRDPKDRYQTASSFDNGLRRGLAASPTRQIKIVTAAVILFLAGFWLSSWWSSDRSIPDPIAQMSQPNWIKYVAALSAKDQVVAVSIRLMQLNEGFDGVVKETIEDGVVTSLVVVTDQVKDISPVRALTGLQTLRCFGTFSEKSNGRLADLSPLQGLPLTTLEINDNARIDDLSPLNEMRLSRLLCDRTGISSLLPLRDQSLSVLVCSFTNVSDLSPLIGMKLKELYCDHTGVADLSPLRGMPLEELHCQETPVVSLEPINGIPLKVLDCHRTLVTDLTPVKGMNQLVKLNALDTRVDDLSPLQELSNIKLLWCEYDKKRDARILRSMKSLEYINDNPVSMFWQESDRAEE